MVTAFRPDHRLGDVVASALRQCARVVVVDNTPDGAPGAREVLTHREPSVLLVRTGRNEGLAAALNRGVQAAGDADVLFLDQDSVLPGDLVDRLERHLADPGVGIAAPAPWDAAAGRYLDPRTSRRPPVADLPVVITSGMLVARRALDVVGRLREEFFVDCVDQDLCLRVRAAGLRVVQDRTVHLPHSLGDTRWVGVGPLRLRSTSHPTWRLYWMVRNGTVLARERWRTEPRWVATSLALTGYVAVTVALVEPPRLRRLATMARGARDGATGRTDRRMLPVGAP